MPSKIGKFMGLFFILIGIIPVLIVSDIKNIEKRCTLEINAVIVDATANVDDDSVTYAPVYQFELNGKITTRTPNILYTSKYPKVGKEVKIYINPDNTDEFYNIETNKEAICVSCIIGFSFIGVGVYIFITSSRIRYRRNRNDKSKTPLNLNKKV